MKEIKFRFREGFEDIERFVNAEMEYISHHLKRILRAFYDLNWPEEKFEYLPQVNFTIEFRRGMPTGGPYARVFEFMFYSDNSDMFELYVYEKTDQEIEESVASARLPFWNWLEAEV